MWDSLRAVRNAAELTACATQWDCDTVANTIYGAITAMDVLTL